MKHQIAGHLLDRRVDVALIGVGGNGSQMLTGLARLHVAMLACGHPEGLRVTVYDPDKVSEANVGRQLFSPSDIGHSKAVVLVHRINMFFGLAWKACPVLFEENSSVRTRENLIISCVDSAAARRQIAKTDMLRKADYWLDMGNRQRDGQVIFGQTASAGREAVRLPNVMDVFPELALSSYEEDNAPSCSLAESLEKQDLFVNDHISRWALHLLWTLFRKGEIEHHGYFINLESGTVNPLPVPDKAA